MPEFHSGFVGLVGRPNVGKSTLLNRVIGEKVAIVTPKPQTTRDRIMGIYHFEGGQIVFLDTPGVHRGKSQLNKALMSEALQAFGDVDLLLALFEPPAAELGYPRAEDSLYLDDENALTLEHLAKSKCTKFLVINKADILDGETVIGGHRGRDVLDPFIGLLKEMAEFEEVFAISAETGEGVDCLVDAAKSRLPEGPAYFPEDMFTNQTDRTFAAEVIREKIFLLTSQEIPYSSAVTIEDFDEEEDPIHIRATIHVERTSQKGILIGKRGQMIKKIGIEARKDIESFLDCRIFLKLDVQVSKDWIHNERIMKRMEFGV